MHGNVLRLWKRLKQISRRVIISIFTTLCAPLITHSKTHPHLSTVLGRELNVEQRENREKLVIYFSTARYKRDIQGVPDSSLQFFCKMV